MSEKIYAVLLRLYPRHFREQYGDEALQLFRDRSRDEAGLLLRLRLWIDLLNDFFASVWHIRHQTPTALAGMIPQHGPIAIPKFLLLDYEAPRIHWMLFAGVMFGLIAFSVGQHENSQALASRLVSLPSQIAAQSSASLPVVKNAVNQAGKGEWLPPSARLRESANTPALWTNAAVVEKDLDSAERQKIIQTVVQSVKEHYFDPKMAQQIADALQAHEKNGDDDVVADKAGLAIALTRQMQQVSHDRHLEVVYSREVLPSGPREPTPEMLAPFRAELEQNNCTFEQVKILPHNIGYLKLNAFPDASVCQSRAAAAMASLNHVNALIFDLRDNQGGSGQMVSLLASYLFDHPEFLYDPRTNPTLRSWTQPVAGNRLADKPVYVLTSSSTISAAEQFAYDLKALKRVTIVGETTGGSAHAGVFYRLDDHFGMGIPRLRAINPFSDEDWEGTGIALDVKVKSANALEVAEQLAVRKLKAK